SASQLARVDIYSSQVEVAKSLVEAGDGAPESAANIQHPHSVAYRRGIADHTAQHFGCVCVVCTRAGRISRSRPVAPVNMTTERSRCVCFASRQLREECVEVGRRRG